ncbi:hypothetical protein DSM3645_27962 [Blastopirellula marina DSM 3645]|uniref:Uncharacterized protein n=1 Tax=Blastopirellula marina DSM 3645 TaxID=314230 RepID=A3ZP18_9BACT|nr:hypothetical protein DSM3645_27962 [Blastopirellula marina DSM 3645]
MAPETKPLESGAERVERTGQAENWGRPSGGADFLLERTGGGFRRARQEGRCGWRNDAEKEGDLVRPECIRSHKATQLADLATDEGNCMDRNRWLPQCSWLHTAALECSAF